MFTRFYHEIKNTFYNPEFYSNLPNIGLSRPFWLFVKLSFISSFVMVAVLVSLAIGFLDDIRAVTEKEYFPSELEIVINNGVATSNLAEEPYYIESNIFDSEILPEDTTHVIVINTKDDLTLSEIEDDEALLFMTKTSIVFKDDGKLRVFKYGEFFEKEVVINKTNTEAIVNKIVQKLPLVIFLGALFALVFITISSLFAWLILALILSLIAIVVNRVRELNLTYRDVYKMSMYATIPAIIIDIITDILFGLNSFSFLLTAAVFTLVLVWNTKPKKEITNAND